MKFLKIEFYKLFLIIGLFIFTASASFAKSLPDGWSIINAGADGKKYMINLKELNIIGSPPQIILFPFIELGSSAYRLWELHCNQKTIKDNGIFRSIANEGTTVRKIIFDGMCGLKYDNKSWTLVGAIFDQSFSTLQAYVFIDLENIQRVNSPFEGVKANILITGWNTSGFAPLQQEEMVSDCINVGRRATRLVNTGSDFSLQDNAMPNSVSHSIGHLVCGNQVRVKDESVKPIINTESLPQNFESQIEKSKLQCESLGFKKGTEKFGDCVLKLSK